MITRNTVQRKVILDAVGDLANHPSAEEVYEYVSEKNPTISKATVYRNLKQLSEAGELLRIENVEVADRYDHNCHEHYHFQCSKCKKVFDIQMEYIDDLEKMVHNDKGYMITGYNLIFKGVCPDC